MLLNQYGQGALHQAACAAGKSWQLPLLLYAELQQEGCPNQASHHLSISACSLASHWQGAVYILGSMPMYGFDRTVVAFAAAMGACVRAFRWRRGLQLLGWLSASRLQLDAVALSIGIATTGRSSRWQLCLQLLEDAREAELQTDIVCANAAITACAAGTAWQHALALMGHGPSFSNPDGMTYAAAITALSKGGLWAHAIRLLQGAARRIDIFGFTSAISACEREGAWEVALKILNDMSATEIRPSALTFKEAVASLGKAVKWMHALELLVSTWGQSHAPSGAGAAGAASIICRGRTRLHLPAGLRDIEAEAPPRRVMYMHLRELEGADVIDIDEMDSLWKPATVRELLGTTRP